MSRPNILTFVPLLKQTIWGGEKIKTLKKLNDAPPSIGESWEISDVEGNVSVVAEGEYRGRTINDLISEHKDAFMGRDAYARYGNEFPLLIKFIDARTDLSIQVHPSDELARKYGAKRGKTEMWYIMESDPDAQLRCGLRNAITPDEYKALVDNDTICDAICKYSVKEGDSFYIPAGRIHSIMAGCLIAEIQETCDITYRIYDYKRKDKNGNYRELHTGKAAEAIDYNVSDTYRTIYTPKKNEPVQLANCHYFTVALYDLTEPMTLDYSDLDSFVVLVCTKGNGTITDQQGNKRPFSVGTTLLLPAWVDFVNIEGTVTFLEAFA